MRARSRSAEKCVQPDPMLFFPVMRSDEFVPVQLHLRLDLLPFEPSSGGCFCLPARRGLALLRLARNKARKGEETRRKWRSSQTMPSVFRSILKKAGVICRIRRKLISSCAVAFRRLKPANTEKLPWRTMCPAARQPFACGSPLSLVSCLHLRRKSSIAARRSNSIAGCADIATAPLSADGSVRSCFASDTMRVPPRVRRDSTHHSPARYLLGLFAARPQ